MTDDDKTVIAAPMVDVAIGMQLSGTYQLDERIAIGGMGEVFRGHNIQTGDAVAIKVVLPEFARDTTILALFRKEATILNHLHHDAIVRYHVFAVDQMIARPYLAMEFVDGVSLGDMLSRGPVALSDALILLSRIASALAAAHEAGVIHRDISPDNIILPGGVVSRAKIIDFGIARSSSVGGATLLGGTFAGKYNYVSPEQLGLFGGEITERSDIYSLGLVMAAALRGQALDMSGSQVEIVEKRRIVPDLADIDERVRPLIEAMLQPKPTDRPQGMADIARWAESLRSGSERPLPRFVPFEPARSAVDAPKAAPGKKLIADASLVRPNAAGPASVPAGRRNRTPIIAAIAALLLVTVGGGSLWYGGLLTDDTPPGEKPDVSAAVIPEHKPPGAMQPVQPDRDKTPESGPSIKASSNPPPETRDDSQQPPPQGVEKAADQSVAAAGAVPKPEPAALGGPKALGELASRIEWLRQYAGGSCFFATATSTEGAKTDIEGFGVDIGGFQKLLVDFNARFGSEPNIGVRLIRPKQCAVTDFLNGLRRNPSDAPTLSLVKYELADRDPMSGELQILPSQQTYLLLIDHDGIVHNLDGILKKTGDRASFNIAVGLGAVKTVDKTAVPQVLLGISASAPLATLNTMQALPAADLLPRVMAEIDSRKVEAAATARYFRIRG